MIAARSFTFRGGLFCPTAGVGETTWEEALARAATLNTGGNSDWRRPIPMELFSWMNLSEINPAINPTFLPPRSCGSAAYRWTRDLYDPTEARPRNGHRDVNNLDGVLADLDTMLMWTQVPSPELERAALVIRARAGDQPAQAELVRLYRRRLRGFLRGLVADPWAAEDVLQVVWVKMVTQIRLLREVPRFETWLFTLARNCALDHRRRLRGRPASLVEEGFWAGLTDPSAEDRVHEIREALEIALRRCSDRDRRLIEQVIEGTTYQVMAEEAGFSLNALKVRLHRLRLHLRREVRALCDSPAA